MNHKEEIKHQEEAGKVALICLAAGAGSRFGSNKLLYPLEGKPMVGHLLEKLSLICHEDSDFIPFVVTRYPEVEAIAMEVSAKDFAKDSMEVSSAPINVVLSPESEKGVSYTIKAGISGTKKMEEDSKINFKSYVFFVADQPFMEVSTIKDFLQYMKKNKRRLGCISGKEHSGNPVWFDREYIPELLALTGDRGGKKVLRAHETEAYYYEISREEEMFDIDFNKSPEGK